jgi:conjugative transfer signal peptidase TraF
MKSSNRTGLYKRILATDWRRVGSGLAFGSGLLFGFFVILGVAGVRINTTPSLPVGIYIQTGSQSPLIEFCPSGESAAIAARRGYRTSGDCPDGASALLKPIVAKYGDVVELTADGIYVNNHLVRNTAPLNVDTEHRKLEHFPFGRYVVADEDVWVASSYNKRSFDSRYYGPVSKRAIRAHLRPLLTL